MLFEIMLKERIKEKERSQERRKQDEEANNCLKNLKIKMFRLQELGNVFEYWEMWLADIEGLVIK